MISLRLVLREGQIINPTNLGCPLDIPRHKGLVANGRWLASSSPARKSAGIDGSPSLWIRLWDRLVLALSFCDVALAHTGTLTPTGNRLSLMLFATCLNSNG